MSERSVRNWSKTFKFLGLAALSAFFILIADHYYKTEKSARDLFSNLGITVFLNKDVTDSAGVSGAIADLGYANVDGYVSSEQAYNDAVAKNPFLKDVSVPGDKTSFTSYLKLSPRALPTEQFLASVRAAVMKVGGVNDVVYDSAGYKKYVQSARMLGLYKKISFVFVLGLFVLFIAKLFLLYYGNKKTLKNIIAAFIIYLLAAAVGFLAVWSAGVFLFFPLLLKDAAVFGVIGVTAVLGMIFTD